ncbi:hypothetical protein Srufu_012930 [Streptomyces libani subsp. rufus]|nr:hypothetical protein Srufu_012930 [Streptomyces libani subsp. rufus]
MAGEGGSRVRAAARPVPPAAAAGRRDLPLRTGRLSPAPRGRMDWYLPRLLDDGSRPVRIEPDGARSGRRVRPR